MARERLTWDNEFTITQQGWDDLLNFIYEFGRSFAEGNSVWFPDGSLNVCVNCVDRHAKKRPDDVCTIFIYFRKIAIIYEAEDARLSRSISFSELLDSVCQVANFMVSLGVRKGDVVAIYMPMVPEVTYLMLACARIGAIHRFTPSPLFPPLRMLFVSRRHPFTALLPTRTHLQCGICRLLCRRSS